MKRTFLIFLSLSLLFIHSTFSQRGKNGAMTISTTQIVNAYTPLINDANAGATTIYVANNSLTTSQLPALAAGDLIFIIQMQGASILDDQWWEGYGYITSYNNAGKYEFAQVASVSGNQIINLTCGLSNSYTASGKTQVVRVPRYSTLSVLSGAELTCEPWNGSTGGVLVVESLGGITIHGTVTASGKGFRGGAPSPQYSTVITVGEYAHTNINYGGQKGEGIAGFGTATGQYCKGPPANGGGGGNAHNGGGGGGANVSAVLQHNGKGLPDTSTAQYKQAWNLESPNFHKNVSYGGGRGGYAWSHANQDATLVGPDNSAWAGDWRRVRGGLGGYPLYPYIDDVHRLFMGGGGGGGSANDTWGGAGGNGGGIIYLMSYGSVTGAGSVVSNGNNGQNSEGTQPGALASNCTGIDGSGGGGGGGAIVINAVGNVTGITITANGGKGGDQVKKCGGLSTNQEAEGPGGGGGGGYIAISNGSPTRTTNGGANGITTVGPSTNPDRNSLDEFPPNGATRGGAGINNGTVTNFTISAPNVMACQGQPITLTAYISGTVPPGTSYGWYTSEFGGTQLSNTTTLTINNPQATTTYYFGTCPGTYRVPVTMYVSMVNADAGEDVTICKGNSTTLHASAGAMWSWSPQTGLSNPYSQHPVCTATTTTTYYVTITNADNCSAVDSVTVYVVEVNPVVTKDTAVCFGNNIILTASGGLNYLWSTGANTSSINVSPAVSQMYYVTVSAFGCSATEDVYVTVRPLPVVNLGNDTTFCQGPTLVLNAGNPGAQYLWQDNSTSQYYNVTSSGQYWVRVTNSYGCVKRDTINVTVLPWHNATITPQAPLCRDAAPVTLQAAEGGGVWSGTGITNPTTGIFNPAAAQIGNNQIVYTISGLCGDSDTANIVVYPVPYVFLGNDTSFCQGPTLVLNAGNSGSQYLWQDNSTNQYYNVTASGLYWVKVTNPYGCVDYDSINVTVIPWSNATITPQAPLCVDAAPVQLQAAQSGGVWSGPGITNTSTGIFNPSVASVGAHQIIYTISGQCGDSDTIQITVNPLPTVHLGNDTTYCTGDTVILNAANPGSQYLWNNASQNQYLSVYNSGTYWVQVTDVNLCKSSDTINLVFLPKADATITPVEPLCTNASPFNLSSAQTGGVWSGNGITNTTTGTFTPATAGAGTHTITYTIAGQCGDADTTSIIVYPAHELTSSHVLPGCPDFNNGVISILVTGGTPPYHFLWNTGDTTASISGLSDGLYIVTVTDKNNCKETLQKELAHIPVDCLTPVYYIPNIFSPNGDGNNDIFYVRGQGISDFTMLIYDRWGEKVFESNDISKGWDGKYKGSDMPSGVYVYYISFKLKDGKTIKKDGNITLVR